MTGERSARTGAAPAATDLDRAAGNSKLVYFFDEGRSDMKGLLGGKGANLAEMTHIGLPVPPGFTITTTACVDYYRLGKRFPQGLEAAIDVQLARLEKEIGKRFGDQSNPLLVSVRSGAAVSMPGMMDTILNLGLNQATVEALAAATQNPRFAYDCYRRFIQMFGNVVMKIEHSKFEEILESHKTRQGAEFDTDLLPETLKEIITDYESLIMAETDREFPSEPREQLTMAVQAVFDSWNNDRAIVYRRLHRIPDDLGTAVNVQAMVFGNMGNDCSTGVVFSRDPSSGEAVLYGEFLVNAQGEDVVAGIRTPKPVSEMERDFPEVYQELVKASNLLEEHYGDMQDIEFTVEKNRLFILQTRTGKRTARAAIKIACDLVSEGKITREQALMRIEPEQIDKLLHRNIDPGASLQSLAQGLPASPGAAAGRVVFDADEAERLGTAGEKVILVRPETTPDDIHGIVQSQGILTSRGGMTCHAAIVARGMGKPCIAGCEVLNIDLSRKLFSVGGTVIKEGDIISIDGGTGNVYVGEVPMVDPELSSEFRQVLEWADEIRSLGVRANADTPEDAAKARDFGAGGIGLCRTEHMFMGQDRLPVMQEMILAETFEERSRALEKLMPMQQADFEGILEAMEGLPVTIRLLDPPLHEFLPDIEELVTAITRLEITDPESPELQEKREILRKARSLAEANPMLGHRGCRLGISFPEIYDMQTRAIFKAAASLVARGLDVHPEVMIPLVSHAGELEILTKKVHEIADEVHKESGVTISYHVGTMIEIPRACLTANEVAQTVEFFSFGTNDLTQTTFGFSRDDAEAKFLHYYVDQKILEDNPFAVLDETGVGLLVEMAVEKGRGVRPDLKVGICGEHGGEPRSIAFCHKTGLDYVSCSPFRVPIARLAAAQAQIRNPR